MNLLKRLKKAKKDLWDAPATRKTFRPAVEQVEERTTPATLELRPRLSDVVNGEVLWSHHDAQSLTPWWNVDTNQRSQFTPALDDVRLNWNAVSGVPYTLVFDTAENPSVRSFTIESSYPNKFRVQDFQSLVIWNYDGQGPASEWDIPNRAGAFENGGQVEIKAATVNWNSGNIEGDLGQIRLYSDGSSRSGTFNVKGAANRTLRSNVLAGMYFDDFSGNYVPSTGYFVIAQGYTGTTTFTDDIDVVEQGSFRVESTAGSFLQGAADKAVRVWGGGTFQNSAAGGNFTMGPLLLSSQPVYVTTEMQGNPTATFGAGSRITFQGTATLLETGEQGSLITGEDADVTSPSQIPNIFMLEGSRIDTAGDVLGVKSVWWLWPSATQGTSTVTINCNKFKMAGATVNVGYLGGGPYGPVNWVIDAAQDAIFAEIPGMPGTGCSLNFSVGAYYWSAPQGTCSKIVNNTGDISVGTNCFINVQKSNMAPGVSHTVLKSTLGTVTYNNQWVYNIANPGAPYQVFHTINPDGGGQTMTVAA